MVALISSHLSVHPVTRQVRGQIKESSRQEFERPLPLMPLFGVDDKCFGRRNNQQNPWHPRKSWLRPGDGKGLRHQFEGLLKTERGGAEETRDMAGKVEMSVGSRDPLRRGVHDVGARDGWHYFLWKCTVFHDGGHASHAEILPLFWKQLRNASSIFHSCAFPGCYGFRHGSAADPAVKNYIYGPPLSRTSFNPRWPMAVAASASSPQLTDPGWH